MKHLVCRIRAFEIVAPYTLHIVFDDASEQVIDFQPVLRAVWSAARPRFV